MKTKLWAIVLAGLLTVASLGVGRADVLWHNPNTDQVAVWLMNGTAATSFGVAINGIADAGWKVVGAGDFNGDGKADVLWHNPDTDQVAVWLMSGTSATAYGTPLQGVKHAGWKVMGAGDFNGDGRADVLWHNPNTDQVAVWLMNGTAATSFGVAINGIAEVGWTVVGAGDFNGDGKADVLWHNPDTDQVSVWLMSGTSATAYGIPLQGVKHAGWKVVGAHDFNGDGKADVLWHNPNTDQVAVWLMNGTAATSFGIAINGIAESGWTVVGAGDFNGDGKADVLWHNPDTDQVSVWLMSGTSVTAYGTPLQGVKHAGWKVISAGRFQ